MTHTESAIQVFCTKEYNCFNMINGNRQLNETKIKKIIKDIDKGCNLLRYCPIIVCENGDKLNIVDGQHRFKVAQVLRSPIWYVIADELSLYDIAKMNSNTEKWKDKDYINCYIQLGNEHYKTLYAVLEAFPIPVTVAISLLQTGRIRGGGNDKSKLKFEQGVFEVKYGREAIEFLQKVSGIQYADKFSRSFLQAIEAIINAGKIKYSEFVDKLNFEIDDTKWQPDFKSYLTHLETIYNKGKHSRITIF